MGAPVRVGDALGSGSPFHEVRFRSNVNPRILGSILDGPRLPILSPGVDSKERITESGVRGMLAERTGEITCASTSGCASTTKGSSSIGVLSDGGSVALGNPVQAKSRNAIPTMLWESIMVLY